ncbi:MAG: VWA domain-containing protein [bacterium]|nr:VWA domain-containing protein [bacterium]
MIREEIGYIDLAFVVDTTSSMTTVLRGFKEVMLSSVQNLVTNFLGRECPISLSIGLIEYRDHPPQDRSFVYRVHDFMKPELLYPIIRQLCAEGGGDWSESVLDGLYACATELSWRERSHRVSILIGDAPPHGLNSLSGWGDEFPDGCPDGHTAVEVCNLLEGKGIKPYAIATDESVFDIFSLLSSCGCVTSSPNKAISIVQNLVYIEMSSVEKDYKIYDKYSSDIALEELAEFTKMSLEEVYRSLGRLVAIGAINESL